MAFKKKKPIKKKSRDEEEDEDDDLDEDDEDDEDEEDEKPIKKKKSKVKVKVKAKSKKSSDDDDEDDDEDEEDDEENEDDEEDEDDDEDEDDEEDEDDDDSSSRRKKSSEGSKWFTSNPKKLDSSGKSDYLKFAQDETKRIVPMQDTLFIYERHYLANVPKGISPYQTCPGDKCPICKVGINKSKAAAVYALELTGKSKSSATILIEGVRFGKKFSRQKTRRGSVIGVIFNITKTGNGTETDWEFEYEGKHKFTPEEKKLMQNKPDFKKRFMPLATPKLKALAKGLGDDDD